MICDRLFGFQISKSFAECIERKQHSNKYQTTEKKKKKLLIFYCIWYSKNHFCVNFFPISKQNICTCMCTIMINEISNRFKSYAIQMMILCQFIVRSVVQYVCGMCSKPCAEQHLNTLTKQTKEDNFIWRRRILNIEPRMVQFSIFLRLKCIITFYTVELQSVPRIRTLERAYIEAESVFGHMRTCNLFLASIVHLRI